MYAEVVPLQRMPRNKTSYTYLVPSAIEGSIYVGQFVEVSLRNKKTPGVIIELHDRVPNYKKVISVEGLLEKTPSWSSAHIQALLECAKYYYSSPSTLINLFAPKFPKRAKEYVKKLPQLIDLPSFKLKKSEVAQIDAIISQAPQPNFIYKYKHHGERFYLYRKICSERDGQILFIAPTHQDALEIYSFLTPHFSQEILLIQPSTSLNEKYSEWQASQSDFRIIIGTRSALFYPCQNLSTIIIDQEAKSEHKVWEASPQYDVRECAQILATQLNIELVGTSSAPRIIPRRKIIESGSQSAPLHLYTHTSKVGLFHSSCQTAIEETIAQQKSVIIIVGHKLGARTVHCLDCGANLKCPNCQVNLYESGLNIICQSCGHQEEMIATCPKCNSTNLKSFGLGIEGVGNHLKSMFKEPVVLLSSKNKHDLAVVTDPTIIVCTPLAWWDITRKFELKVGYVLFFHPETMLFAPDHKVNEKYYHLISWYRTKVFDYFEFPLAIQSKLDQENLLMSDVLTDNYAHFSSAELQDRQASLMPPFSDMIKLSLKGADLVSAPEEEAISNRLRGAAEILIVIGAFSRHLKNGTTSQNWLIKIKPGARPELDKILGSSYNSFIIDRNPDRT